MVDDGNDGWTPWQATFRKKKRELVVTMPRIPSNGDLHVASGTAAALGEAAQDNIKAVAEAQGELFDTELEKPAMKHTDSLTVLLRLLTIPLFLLVRPWR